ncbi:MAG: hypothetical protein EOO88_08880 [Pedobacter sp.]|nr:MAG: hypothetical protein EOO88_08880 [Pedobacter sp.]
MIKKVNFNFPLVFELLIWVFYVGMYKYSAHLEYAHLPHIPNNDFPYLGICLYSICSMLFLIPYYRLIVPKLMTVKRYWLLLLVTLVYFIPVYIYALQAMAWIFAEATPGMVVQKYFVYLFNNPFLDIDVMLVDLLTFLCLAFARFSYQAEQRRYQVETDNLHMQLSMLKTQLQPHFLFNTLNSLYGLSLTGSKETPRFILLLSQMMQYILYDCDKELVEVQDETGFLKGYFELEQQKFPTAKIVLDISIDSPGVKIPPLIFLPLVENSFKHGRHKLEDGAAVDAKITITTEQIDFEISNDKLQYRAGIAKERGGIGLVNIRKRLELYYPGKYTLEFKETADEYHAHLNIKLI